MAPTILGNANAILAIPVEPGAGSAPPAHTAVCLTPPSQDVLHHCNVSEDKKGNESLARHKEQKLHCNLTTCTHEGASCALRQAQRLHYHQRVRADLSATSS